MRAFTSFTFLIVALVTASCGGPTVDLTQALQLEMGKAGWYDAGIVNGQNKLVPAVSVRLTNLSNQKLPVLQLNASFHRVSSKEEWGSSFLTVAGSDGLAPGATTGTLMLRSQNGYTSSGESRQEMLENSHFVDATVDISAKYGSTQWVRMGQFPIPRELLQR